MSIENNINIKTTPEESNACQAYSDKKLVTCDLSEVVYLFIHFL